MNFTLRTCDLSVCSYIPNCIIGTKSGWNDNGDAIGDYTGGKDQVFIVPILLSFDSVL
jgi:hypothetical protein